MATAKNSFEKVKKSRTKSQVFGALADTTGLSKKEVSVFFDSLNALIGQDLKAGPGQFNLPGMVKLKVVRKPSAPARKGVNPFTGEQMTFKARPARNIVRARPLKALKDAV